MFYALSPLLDIKRMTEREKTRSRAIMCSKIRGLLYCPWSDCSWSLSLRWICFVHSQAVRGRLVVGVFLCRICFVHSQTFWQFVSWENEFQGTIEVPVFTERSRTFWCTTYIQKWLLLLSRSCLVRDQFLTSPSVAHRMYGPNSKMRTQTGMITGHIHEVYARQCNNRRLRRVLKCAASFILQTVS